MKLKIFSIFLFTVFQCFYIFSQKNDCDIVSNHRQKYPHEHYYAYTSKIVFSAKKKNYQEDVMNSLK